MAREVAVTAEGQFAQEEIAHGVDAVFLDELRRRDKVTERFRHLLALDRPPAMGEDAPRRRQAGGHQEGRPIDRVEARDILANHVKIGRPKR